MDIKLRAELAEIIRPAFDKSISPYDAADAIMERFDVVPKPAITDFDLGVMVDTAGMGDVTTDTVGKRMRKQLEKAGLKIVRVDDER